MLPAEYHGRVAAGILPAEYHGLEARGYGAECHGRVAAGILPAEYHGLEARGYGAALHGLEARGYGAGSRGPDHRLANLHAICILYFCSLQAMVPPMTESFYRRNLPHWETRNATYFVTMCLAGSAPASGCLSPRRPERRPLPKQASSASTGTASGRNFVVYDTLLDRSPRVRWLEDPPIARIAIEALHWGEGSRYDLICYVVMPNHVHWVFRPLTDCATQVPFRRLSITSAFKSYTALACNRHLGRQGRFWQEESYDRVVRDEQELERIVRYVEYNPVRAGLCTRPEEWAFSSAGRPL